MKRSITLQGPPPATDARVTPPTRELAERLSGTAEILLLWHPETERVELSVLDQATGAGFRIGVAPEDAMEAFDHPYAYAAKRQNSDGVELEERMIFDG
jgi:hypothetical protein